MKAVRIILIFIISFYLMYQGIQVGMRTHNGYKVTTRCGTITFKGNSEQVRRHSTTTEFVLVVEYENGNREDEIVSASTWSSHKIGDRVCFNSRQVDKTNLFLDMNGFNVVAGFIAMLIVYLFVGFGICAFIYWLFTGKNLFKKEK